MISVERPQHNAASVRRVIGECSASDRRVIGECSASDSGVSHLVAHLLEWCTASVQAGFENIKTRFRRLKRF